MLLLDIGIEEAVFGVGSTFEIDKVAPGTKTLTLLCNFDYGGDGTSAKAYVQTSFDGGNTWLDIACFAATTASAKKLANLSALTPVATFYTPTDEQLADNTTKDGLIGPLLRVKYVTVGTYILSNLQIYGYFK